MPPLPSGDRSRDLSLLVFGIAALLFGSPIRLMWAQASRIWYLPFTIWLLVILLGAWAVRAAKTDEG